MDVKMHLDVHPQHIQQEQMLDDVDQVKNSSRPRRKSSFRRMYEACDRMVQLYFAEGDEKVYQLLFSFQFAHVFKSAVTMWKITCCNIQSLEHMLLKILHIKHSIECQYLKKM